MDENQYGQIMDSYKETVSPNRNYIDIEEHKEKGMGIRDYYNASVEKGTFVGVEVDGIIH